MVSGNEFNVPLEFNKFDPALGTLNSVTLDVTASYSGSIGIENLSASPDVANGIVFGSVTASTNNSLFSVEVFTSMTGPVHHLTAFDGAVDFAGTSGATDTVVGSSVTGSATAPPPTAVLPEFIGTAPIDLSLIATALPVVTGLETEEIVDTADAHTTDVLTYRYTSVAIAEPAGWTIVAAGLLGLFGLRLAAARGDVDKRAARARANR